MSDLANRLREEARDCIDAGLEGNAEFFKEAADEVDRLQAELEQAREVIDEAKRIQTEAHLKGDQFTYDLMRTVLAPQEPSE